MKTQDIDAVILSKEEAFWTQKKQISESLIKDMEAGLKDIPNLIRFHKAVMKMCDEYIKKEQKHNGKNKV